MHGEFQSGGCFDVDANPAASSTALPRAESRLGFGWLTVAALPEASAHGRNQIRPRIRRLPAQRESRLFLPYELPHQKRISPLRRNRELGSFDEQYPEHPWGHPFEIGG